MASRDYRRTIHCMTNRILALAVAGAVPLAALVLASPAAGVAASETQECAVDGTFSRVLGQGDTLAVTVGGSCTSVTASAGLAGSISVSGAGELPAGAAVAVAPGAVVTYTATANRSVDAAIQFTLSSAGGAVASAYAITTPAVEPAAPEEPVVTLDGSSADISWDEPDNGGAAITDYKVQYSINGGSAWTTYADAVTAATVATMPGLDPAENYLFRVAAVNSVGTGPYSASAAPAVMPVAPTGLTAVSASGAVNLSWTSPVGASGITDYKIGYSSNGGGTWTTAPRVASTATTASITNLTPGTYIFRVAATNPAGTGPNSTSSSSVTIAEAVSAPGAPTGVTASISGSTFAVSWTAPSGSVTKYTLQYSTNNGTTWTGVAIHTTAVTAATITSLKTAGTYVFKVAAVNAIGTGEYSAPSAPVEFVPPATVPSAPTKLTASRTNEVITLTWVAPAGTVTGYVAQYSINNGTTWTSLTLPEGIATSAAVTTLKDPGSYLFKVAAVNTGGTGAYSAASTALVIASATETGPAAPKGLAAKAGKTSLTLTWTAPSGVTGITDYKVEYSATGTSWTVFEHTASPALTREVTGLTSDTKYFVRVSTVTTSAGAPTSAITAVTLTADGKPGTGGDGASATPASGADEGETAVGKAPADSEVTLLSIKKPSLKPESAPRLEVDAGENYKVTTKVSRGPSGRKAAVSVQVGDEWVKLGKSVVKKNGEVTLPAIAANTPGEYLVKISIPKKPARYILLVVS